eukprot:scaffold10896_cov20-Prasinocladus_malaysianus.AAC.1
MERLLFASITSPCKLFKFAAAQAVHNYAAIVIVSYKKGTDSTSTPSSSLAATLMLSIGPGLHESRSFAIYDDVSIHYIRPSLTFNTTSASHQFVL